MKRLFEDPAVPSDLRAELEQSRRAGHDYDVLAKLPQLREALDGARPSVESALLERGPAASLSVASAWKLALLIAAAVGAATYLAWPEQVRRMDSEPASRPLEPAPVAPPAIPPIVDPAEPPARLAEEVAPPQPEPTPQAGARSSRREIAQLVRIRALLESDPTAAYRLAQRSEQEFPEGVLSEERRAMQVLALAKSGATEAARRKAELFFARYPQSPMRELVEGALGR